MEGRRAAALLSRESELEAITALVAEAGAGRGRALLITGPAGIGKTSLMAEALARAEREGFELLRARGSELEETLPFGIARSLLEAPLRRIPARERKSLLSGAESAATAVITDTRPEGSRTNDELSAVHGLYRVIANLAARSPVLVAVDDTHWADPPSLRWLAYLVHRIEDLPVFVVIAARTGEAAVHRVLDAIATEPVTAELRLRPLDSDAVAKLVRTVYDPNAEDSFCRACWDASGGNPFMCRELIAAAASDQLSATVESAPRIRELTPPTIIRSVVMRLGRLGPEARKLACCVAVLGPETPLHRAAAMAELGCEAAAEAADALAEADIFATDRPLDFAHPVLRSAVYEDMPAGERGRCHRVAAKVLEREGAPTLDIATHLLSAEPAGEDWTVQTLLRAAAATVSPESAVSYLERALAEPPPKEMRRALLLELGEAEGRSLQHSSIDHLFQALELSEGALDRGEVALPLGVALNNAGRRDEAEAILGDAIVQLEATDDPEARALALMIRGEYSRFHPEEIARTRRLAEAAATPAERFALSWVAYRGANAGFSADEIAEIARRSLTGPRAATDHFSAFVPFLALEFADRLEEAEDHLVAELEDARAVGSPTRAATAMAFLAVMRLRRGRLAQAREGAAAALALGQELELGWLCSLNGAVQAAAALELGELDATRRALDASDPTAAGAPSTSPSNHGLHLLVRGHLFLAENAPADARSACLEAGELIRANNHDHPGFYLWRSGAALAELALGAQDAALELVAEELGRARAFGCARSLGAALRVAGLVRCDLGLLEEAVQVLERSPARLEYGKALLDLGSALRRAGQRAEGKDSLRQALEVVDACAATPLIDRARAELASLGLRPRRAALSGVEALTASELRVAQLASDGLTNKEIAQSLFVSVKTVERHLAHIFQKLNLSSRKELPAALGAVAKE